MYMTHPFWKAERFCPAHQSDGTLRCTACQRLCPRCCCMHLTGSAPSVKAHLQAQTNHVSLRASCMLPGQWPELAQEEHVCSEPGRPWHACWAFPTWDWVERHAAQAQPS